MIFALNRQNQWIYLFPATPWNVRDFIGNNPYIKLVCPD